MKDQKLKLKRRQFLKFISSQAITLPVALTIGCKSGQQKYSVVAPILDPEESLRKLILLFGPWSYEKRGVADNFTGRFLQAKHASGVYLSESGRLVQSLASRFPADTLAIKEIDLRRLPTEEQELLMDIVKQLYSFIEIRFVVCKEPPWGQCQADRVQYTRAPVAENN